MENLTGKQFGTYQITGALGEGGMAAVYKAYQTSVDRTVAIKVLPRQLASDPEFVSRFKREALLLAKLQHPHILPVFDYGESEGYTYLVMPFITGGTLTAQLSALPTPLSTIRKIISQLGDALDYAHTRGLVHRDIKPSNVLIDEGGNCLLSDFGIAKIVEGTSRLTSSGAIIGTPYYMSPEQGSGRKIDARTDVYALGVMLFEMATGRVPYMAETPVAVIFKHIQDPLPIPRQFNPALPEAVEKVIVTALAKRPEDRYQTAGDLVRALQAAIPGDTHEGKGAPGQEVRPTTKPVDPWPARKPVWPWVLGGCGVLLILAIVIAAAGGATYLVSKLKTTPSPIFLLASNQNQTATLGEQPTPMLTVNTPQVPSEAVTAAPMLAASTSMPGKIIPISTPILTLIPQSSKALDPQNASQAGQLDTMADLSAKKVRWSPDGTELISAGYNITVLDGQTHQRKREISTDGNWINDLRISPDGHFLVFSTSNSVQVYDYVSSGQLYVKEGIASANGLGISPDGKYLAVAENMVVKIFNLPDGSEVTTLVGHQSTLNSVAFSPDGKTLASADNDIKLWDITTWKELATLKGHDSWVKGLAFSPDGLTLASASTDNTIKLWDTASGLLRTTLTGHTGQVEEVAFSPDGRLLASAGWDPSVILWDTATGSLLKKLTGHSDWVISVAFSPDGSQVASASSFSVRFWGLVESNASTTPYPTAGPLPTSIPLAANAIQPANAAQVKLIGTLENAAAKFLSWQPGTNHLLVGWNDVTIYAIPDMTKIQTLGINNWIYGMSVSMDGKKLVTLANNELAIWDMFSGSVIATYPGPQYTQCLTVSPDGISVAMCESLIIRVVDLISGKDRFIVTGFLSSINAIAFSPDGKTLVTAGQDIQFWDAANGNPLNTLKNDGYSTNQLVFSQDGKWLLAVMDNKVVIWDTLTQTQTRAISLLQDHAFGIIAISPDGQTIAASESTLPIIHLFNLNTGQDLAQLTGHSGQINSMAFSPDGAYLASGSESDHSVRLWAVQP
jgi:WD40 repeat protein